MSNFSVIYRKLTLDVETGMSISICGVDKQVRGSCEYYSPGYDTNYVKVLLNDGSILLLVPEEEALSYSEKGDVGAISGVSDADIGKDQLEIGGIMWKKIAAVDYQHTIRLYCGKPGVDAEGEVRFCDYENVSNPDEVWSIAIDSETGRRADVFAVGINVEDVKI